MAIPPNLQQAVNRQADATIRGRAFPRPDVFNQKHIFSTYHFTAGSAPNPIVSNVLAAGDYILFSAGIGQNGQGLPAGLSLDDRDTNFPGQGGNIPAGYSYDFSEGGLALYAQRDDVVSAVGGTTRLGPMHPLDADQFLNGTAIILKKDNVDLNLGCAAWWTQPGAPADTAFSLVDESAGAGAVAGPPSYVTGGLAVDTAGGRQQRWSANGGAIGPAPALRRRLEVPLLLAQLVQFNIVLRVSRPITFLSVDQGGTNGFSARWDFWGTESSPVGRT